MMARVALVACVLATVPGIVSAQGDFEIQVYLSETRSSATWDASGKWMPASVRPSTPATDGVILKMILGRRVDWASGR